MLKQTKDKLAFAFITLVTGFGAVASIVSGDAGQLIASLAVYVVVLAVWRLGMYLTRNESKK